jgi:hypothetical protein
VVLPSSCANLDLTIGLNTDDEKFIPGRIAASMSRGGIEPEQPHCALCRRQLCCATVPPSATGLVADDGQCQTWATIRSGLSAGLQQAVDLGHQWSQATPEVSSTRRDS